MSDAVNLSAQELTDFVTAIFVDAGCTSDESRRIATTWSTPT